MYKFITAALLIAATVSCNSTCSKSCSSDEAKCEKSEKAVQHLKVADITSMDEAKKVFAETNTQLKSKKKLDAVELHEIHMITYSTEKAVAYFAENLNGSQQKDAKNLAVVLEEVHIASENNRSEETNQKLAQYFKQADALSSGLK